MVLRTFFGQLGSVRDEILRRHDVQQQRGNLLVQAEVVFFAIRSSNALSRLAYRFPSDPCSNALAACLNIAILHLALRIRVRIVGPDQIAMQFEVGRLLA